MVESYGDSISMAPARGCWRLAHVQTSGGMATLVRSDQQADTQQLILDYVADNSCDVVGLGDTRLGDDPSELTRMARGIQARVAREREEATSIGAFDGNEGRDKREAFEPSIDCGCVDCRGEESRHGAGLRTDYVLLCGEWGARRLVCS